MTFVNCTFQTTGTNDHRAICASDSRFKLGGGSTIDGYMTGVEVNTSLVKPYPYYIENTVFSDNQVSIASWNVNNFTVKDNDFEGIGAFDGSDRQTGLSVTNGSGFTITGNTFVGIPGATENTGILADNTGGGPNEIIGNTNFEGLYAANWATGNNKGNQIGAGLQYLCNTNNSNIDNTYDFLVEDGSIAGSQGGGLATKNIFSHLSSSSGDSDFNNQGDVLIYYHASPQNETPEFYTTISIEPFETPLLSDCSGGVNDVGIFIPIHDGNTKLTTAQLVQLEQDFVTVNTNYDTLLVNYQAQLNGGLTETVLAGQIMSSTAQDVSQLEQDLLAYSPYLTTGVLEAVVARSDIFSDNSIEGILGANPDELRSLDFQAFLYSELDGALVDSILTDQDQLTARTDDIAELTRSKLYVPTA